MPCLVNGLAKSYFDSVYISYTATGMVWLHDSKHQIEQYDRPSLLSKFKSLVYAETAHNSKKNTEGTC